MSLEIKNLSVSLKDEDQKDSITNEKSFEIIKDINIKISDGEIVALMGPNGSGKSTLAYAIMGNPKYSVNGNIILNGEDITEAKADERARKGLFLSFQNPLEISGVSIASFLRAALNSKANGKRISPFEFKKLFSEKLEILKIDRTFADRYLNEGFSGGEKKKTEILQLAILQPKYAILDETDSGLDIDALKAVAEGINTIRKEKKIGILLITHYNRILNYIKPDKVYVMQNGRLVSSGGAELAAEIEEKGYEVLN